MKSPHHHVSVVAFLASAAAFLSGCASAPPPPGELYFTAAWQPWHDDPFPHLILNLANNGGSSLNIGPGGEEILVTGPLGAVPLYWGETTFARPVYPNQAVVVGLHPRAAPEGTFGLAIDHAWGVPTAPPVGLYTICIESHCQPATLSPS